MADETTKPERFKAAMPQIPGVGQAQPAPDEAQPAGTNWLAGPAGRIGIPLGAALILTAGIAWWAMRSPRPPSTPDPSANVAPSSMPVPVRSDSAAARSSLHSEGSAGAATVQELTEAWSSKKFTFRKRLTNESVPAIVVRLPGSAAGHSESYWAFSLRAPFGRCELEYVTDLNELATKYGFRAQHPMVADPCTSTVYDPLRMGSAPGGVWVRGEVVQGAALRPPLGIELRLQGNHLIAERME